MKSNRRLEIENYVLKKEHATMDELVDVFRVSMNTIRNDIRYLEKKGTLRKVYGGVEKLTNPLQTDFDIREVRNTTSKQKICEYAARLISDGDVIFCDSGTTTKYLLNFVDPATPFTLITNNLDIINDAMENNKIVLISLPGILARNTRSFVDQNTSKLLRKYNITKSFISTTAVSEDGSMTNSSELECEIKRTAIEQSKFKYLLCDTSKFGRSSLLSFYNVHEMDLIISAGEVTSEVQRFSSLEGFELVGE